LTSHGNYLITQGTALSNFIPSVTSAAQDLHVNSFVMNPANDSQFRLLQEVTFAGATELSIYMNGVKWFRIGTRLSPTGIWSWTQWSKTVTGNDKVQATNGLNSTGSFNSGDMTVKHNNKAQSLVDTTNTTVGQVVENIAFDPQGHPIQVSSRDLNGHFVRRTGSLFDVFYFDSLNTANPQDTLDQALQKYAKHISGYQVKIGYLDISGQYPSTWITVPYVADDTAATRIGTEQPGHNLFNHHVVYRRQDLGGGQMSLDVAIFPIISQTKPFSRVDWNAWRIGTMIHRYRGNNLGPGNSSSYDNGFSGQVFMERIFGWSSSFIGINHTLDGVTYTTNVNNTARFALSEYASYFQNALIVIDLTPKQIPLLTAFLQ
jgi:hypothetical protein